jgi:hypothetical protein
MLTTTPPIAATRMGEARSYLHLLGTYPSPPPTTIAREVAAAKGLFFVYLYGVYEFTVKSIIQETVSILNNMSLRIVDCKPVLLSLILSADCDSIRDVGRDKLWPKRQQLFAQINTPQLASINTAVMPTSGKNLRLEELESIWGSFGLTGSILPTPRSRIRIEELVNNRNAIAHGSDSPTQVGSRYTVTELSTFLQDIDLICTHLLQSFSSYLTSGDYHA